MNLFPSELLGATDGEDSVRFVGCNGSGIAQAHGSAPPASLPDFGEQTKEGRVMTLRACMMFGGKENTPRTKGPLFRCDGHRR